MAAPNISGQQILFWLNDKLQKPYVRDAVWYIHSLIITLIVAPLASIGLVILFLRDLFTGYLNTERYEEPHGRAVIITGCDTGFGKELAVRLGGRGWHVYAGCLTPQGCHQYLTIPNTSPLILDVTKPEDIRAAVERVGREHPHTLHALVNNAGTSKAGPFDWQTMDELKLTMDVNFWGLVMMVKAFLPLLKRSRGRIVNMSSILGVIPGGALSGMYSASKHAVEAFSSTLRYECRGWGIPVITLCPTFHDTSINRTAVSSVQSMWDRLDQTTRDEYGVQYLVSAINAVRVMCSGPFCWPPDHVINALSHAVTSVKPRHRYIVGVDGLLFMVPFLALPNRIHLWIQGKAQGVDHLVPIAAAATSPKRERAVAEGAPEELKVEEGTGMYSIDV